LSLPVKVADGAFVHRMTDRVHQAQAGIRRLPITARLAAILHRAAEVNGLKVRVTSGGQPPRGGGRRTGSSRHDVGGDRLGAADLQLIDETEGYVLDMGVPRDLERMAAFVTETVFLGANGVGAGVGYMGPKTIHVGGGSVLAWGAGGRASTAPEWLVAAHKAGLAKRTR
jgi:hypothetical protein